MLRYLTAGESHGPALVVVVEGLPAGIPITIEEVSTELARRRLGYGRGPRMRFERDDIEFLGGVRHGATLGSPVAIIIHNSEWETGKWREEMGLDKVSEVTLLSNEEARRLPWSDGAFDLVLAVGVVEHLPESDRRVQR